MHYPKETVSLALFFMVFCSLDASLTAFILKNIFGVSVSHDSLNRWFRKSALRIHKNLGPLPIQECSEVHTDETVFKADGHKKWLWFTKDYTYDSIQSWLFSHRRATEFARSLLARAYKTSPCIGRAKIVSDGLWSYGSAIGDLKDFSLKNHIIYKDFKEPVNNNRLERHWSTLKTIAKRFRGFKSMLGLWSFVTLQVYYHNYFKPNKRLNGLTPAEATGMPLPHFKSKWKLFMHLLK
jgi:transposase-like protein